ncbi:hypothetical protein Avbf_06743 [Armadillidium vulgare]|nr:hypothetical protein Avbf_06743 [Armadillidium vulgare]
MDNEIEVKIEDEPFSLSEDLIEDVSEFEKLQTCINPDSDFLLIQDFKGEELELEFDFDEKSFSEHKHEEIKPINLKFKDKTQQKIHVSPDKKAKTSSEKVEEDLTIKILIKCNGRAAVVNIESDLSFITLQDIKRIAAKYLGEPLASNVDRFSIFRYELDFREWILLKDASSLRNLDKLEFRESDSVNSENKKRVLFKWGHKAAVVDVERNLGENLTLLNPMNVIYPPSSRENMWSLHFKLPPFEFASKILESGEKLKKFEHSTILKAIFLEVVDVYGILYPSTVDYENITKALLDQYPKMYSKDGYQTTFERWKKSISEKFRNERDRIDSSTLPEALFKQLKSKKRQNSSNDEMESSSKKKKGLHSLKFNIEKKEIVSDTCSDAGGGQNDEIRESTEAPLEVESTSPHSRYPSSFDYDCITKALLGQYPNLVSKDGYRLTFKRWKKSISQNFRNERDRMDPSSLPQVLLKQLKEKKRQSSSNDKTESSIDEAEDLQSVKSLIEAHEYLSGKADIERGKIFDIREETEASEIGKSISSYSRRGSIWSYNFKLPSFGIATRNIANGGRLRKKERSIILKAIFQKKRWKKSIIQNFANERDRVEPSSLPEYLLKQLRGKKKQSLLNGKTEEAPLDETEDTQVYWSQNFKLPSFGFVERKLVSGNKLKKLDQSIILKAIFHKVAYVHGDLYPTRCDYKNITKALLNQYPKLYVKDEYRSTLERWKKSIIKNFRNERKKLDSPDLPEVLLQQLRGKNRQSLSNDETDAEEIQSLKFLLEANEFFSDVINIEIEKVTEEPTVTECQSFHSSQENIWSLNFKLPSFGLVTSKIKNGEKLRKLDRSTILRAIFVEVVHVHRVLYPSRFDYDNITESLLNQYPKLYLRDGYERAFEGWKRSITQIFRNERERMNPSSLPEKQKETIIIMNKEAETPLAKEESLSSFKYYLPGRTTGETDKSIQNHIQFLKNEKNKEKPNYEKVSLSMRATFGDRRNKLVLQQSSVASVLEEYPWLLEEDEIVFEYGRICGSNYCSEIEKHFVDIHLHLKNLEREKSQISVGVCSIQTHEEDEGFLVLNGFKSLISLMNEKEFLSEDSTPYAKKHYKTLSYIEKFMLNITKTSDTKYSKFVSVKDKILNFPFNNKFIFFRFYFSIKKDGSIFESSTLYEILLLLGIKMSIQFFDLMKCLNINITEVFLVFQMILRYRESQ